MTGITHGQALEGRVKRLPFPAARFSTLDFNPRFPFLPRRPGPSCTTPIYSYQTSSSPPTFSCPPPPSWYPVRVPCGLGLVPHRRARPVFAKESLHEARGRETESAQKYINFFFPFTGRYDANVLRSMVRANQLSHDAPHQGSLPTPPALTCVFRRVA